MTSDMAEKQVPLQEALEVRASSPGEYLIALPASACFGPMVHGGFIVSYMLACGRDFLSNSPRTANQAHCRHTAVHFFRPTFPSPDEATFSVRTANVGKAWSTVHIELTQAGKVCVTAYLTYTNLLRRGNISADTRWKPSPPIAAVDLQALERDEQEGWLQYITPYAPTAFRRAHSYMRYHFPTAPGPANTQDSWVTPGWNKNDGTEAVWTNDLVPFVLDNARPVVDNFFPSGQADGHHAEFVRGALAQRQARKDGRSNRDVEIHGQGVGGYSSPFVVSTLALQIEIKKRLPDEGVKWLFVRAQSKSVEDDRMDMEIVLFNEDLHLVAVCHQVVQIVLLREARVRRHKI